MSRPGSDPDVIVVGGGPVGVAAATLLARRNLSVQVFEREPEVYPLPRAIVMDDEIQRMFQSIGALADLEAITTPLRGAEFVRPGGDRLIGSEIPAGHRTALGLHPSVCFYQPDLEDLLRRLALESGVEISLGVEVASVDQDDAGVSVETSAGACRARWLVAADGASSPIRKHLGIAFHDLGFDQSWLVLDVKLKDVSTPAAAALPELVQQICDPTRPTTFVTGHADYRRWEFQLQPGETKAEMEAPDRVWELLAPWLTVDDADLLRAVVYQFHATVAGSMRDRRIFLAGDAAHQMPPFLGQGLCSGLRDAVNLSWKLDFVDKGRADDSLLGTYGDERLPHARGVVAHAVDAGRLIDELSGRVTPETTLESGYGGGRPFPVLTGGLLHGDHPSVGRQLPQIDGPQSLEDLLGPDFAVIVEDSALLDRCDPRWRELGRVLVLPASALAKVLPDGGALFVRPDRCIAAVARDQDEFDEASEALLTVMA